MKDEYLVGTSGTIVSTKKYVKDADDNWWSVDTNGVVENWGSDDYAKDLARCASQNKTAVEKNNSDGELTGYTCN